VYVGRVSPVEQPAPLEGLEEPEPLEGMDVDEGALSPACVFYSVCWGIYRGCAQNLRQHLANK
jgi:hypothetical protein